ncbi:hypothetical protein AS890_06980 [Rhizobium anhuiense bv. trifolii]|nr:hypothetical protein [Rhizobium anhuiense]KZS56955.1 hypothetical protein AS890_06980 [Rhizobium anhuiense bv. trifolii]
MGSIEAVVRSVAETRFDFQLALFDLCPEFVGNNPQLRHLADHPLALVIHPRFTVLRLRVLPEIASVEYEPADIGLVVENAGTPISVTANSSVTPFEPTWAWNCGQAAVEFDSQFLG